MCVLTSIAVVLWLSTTTRSKPPRHKLLLQRFDLSRKRNEVREQSSGCTARLLRHCQNSMSSAVRQHQGIAAPLNRTDFRGFCFELRSAHNPFKELSPRVNRMLSAKCSQMNHSLQPATSVSSAGTEGSASTCHSVQARPTTMNRHASAKLQLSS